MAYALVLSDTEHSGKEKQKFRWLRFFCRWFNPFLPGRIQISQVKLSADFSFFTVTMPCPEAFYLKNKLGRKRTLKKWRHIVADKGIDCYLTEECIGYIEGGWSDTNGSYLTEILNQKVPDLFEMEPLKSCDYERMTLTVSGVEKKWMSDELAELLGRFKQINTINGELFHAWWDSFMNETGVPVCQTYDTEVLSRSDIWISFKQLPGISFFHGLHVDLENKMIGCTDINKTYKIGFIFKRSMIKRLGLNILRRFESNTLACFLIHAWIQSNPCLLVFAAQKLGIKISIISDRLYLNSKAAAPINGLG